MEKFTREQMMLYLFGEASPILMQSIDQTLKDDYELQKEMETLKRSKKQLEKLAKTKVSPSQKTIDSILKYAKDSSKKKNW